MEGGWRTGETGAKERGFIRSCEALGESEHGWVRIGMNVPSATTAAGVDSATTGDPYSLIEFKI